MRHTVERLHGSAGGRQHGQPAERRARVGIDVDADAVQGVDAAALTVGHGTVTPRYSASDVSVLERRPGTHSCSQQNVRYKTDIYCFYAIFITF